ncbi:Site-2 protease family protein [Planctomycetales bacterium 10988]|nr:Site-2 protease family protein [Planctomycetales bacterium 10988]
MLTFISMELSWWFFHGWRWNFLSGQPDTWREAFLYGFALIAILLCHELGHYLQAVRYRVAATLPIFIPMPLNPLGTLGAIILMDGLSADRKELFDIGLSGPIAGMVIALPMCWLGIAQAEPVATDLAPIFGEPLLWKGLVYLIHGPISEGMILPLSPFGAAGWAGLFLTGLNMLPISHLDGGHVTHALFGKRARYLAYSVLMIWLLYTMLSGYYSWLVMIFLLFMIGPTHPPTANDRVPLGTTRTVIGYASLLLPILCFTPMPINPEFMQ